METLANLEAFIRTADCGSFSAAARRLGMTPAAVSRNVAMLERYLGVRLFQRSSRSLTLTEDGERFLATIADNVESIRLAVANIAADAGKPAGVLRVSMLLALGLGYVLPLLPAFIERYPDVHVDWSFENRQADLIGGGFDAAIGGGMNLAAGIIAQRLAPLHVVAVASPAYMQRRPPPQTPSELAAMDGVSMRSALTGRVRIWRMRNRDGAEAMLQHKARVTADEPEAICHAALMGLGVAMITMTSVERHLHSGALLRLLPDCYADLGAVSLYFPSQKLLPAKTRAFIDYMQIAFREQNLARRFSAHH